MAWSFTRTVLLLILFAPAHADEALLRESAGSLAAVTGESTSIRLVSERVVIALGVERYTVDASFVFVNEGDTVTVPVGFPDVGYGYAGTFRGIRDNDTFETWVDGKACDFRVAPGRLMLHSGDGQELLITDPDSLAAAHAVLRQGGKPAYTESEACLVCEELRWYVKEVTFPAGERTTTRVRYEVANDVPGFSFLEYTYGTGGTWKGTIGEAVFVIRTTPEMWMQRPPQFTRRSYAWRNARAHAKRRLGEFEHEYRLTDVEPAEDEVIRVFFRDCSLRRPEQPWDNEGSFAFADSLVPEDFLDLLSLAQLRLLRNAFYAYRGKVFDDPELAACFHNTYWYSPRPEFRDGDLTDTDRANVERVRAQESRLKALIDPP